MVEIVTGIIVTKACISAFIAALEAMDGDWPDATTAASEASIPFIGKLLNTAHNKRINSCDYQIKALADDLTKLMTVENISSNEQNAIFADIRDFAPQIIKETIVKPHDLPNWDGNALDSVAQKAVKIAVNKLNTVLQSIPMDEYTRTNFKNGNIRQKALIALLTGLYTRQFMPPSQHDIVILEEIKAGQKQNNENHCKTHDGIDKLLARASNEDALIKKNESLEKELEEVRAELTKQNSLEAQEAVDDFDKDDPEKAKLFYKNRAEQRKETARATNKSAAEDYRRVGALAFLNNTQEALSAYREATELDSENIDGWNILGHLLRRVRKFSEARSAYENVVRIGTANKDDNLIGTGHFGIANIYREKKQFSLAEEGYIKALNLFSSEPQDISGIANVDGNLGGLYSQHGLIRKAKKHVKRSLNFNRTTKNKEGISIDLSILGTIYEQLGHKYTKYFHSALSCYEEALDLNIETNDEEGIAVENDNIGCVYGHLGNFVKMKEHFEAALPTLKRLGRNTRVQEIEACLAMRF